MKNILLLGYGHMGHSLAAAWINSKEYFISAVDPKISNDLIKKNKFKKVKFYKSVNEIRDFVIFDFIIFAVRPRDTDNLLNEIKNIKLNKNTIIISVIAGKKISLYSDKLKNCKKFVRVMPNMPSLIGQGMNCIFTKNLSKKNNLSVKKLFQSTGVTYFFKKENHIDMATAISGSGPGYVFNLIDALEKAAISIGFKKNDAKILVAQTFKGSVELLIKSKIDAEKLVKTVATKGGTTEAGLKIMKSHKIHNIFKKLVKSSYAKARKQGK